MLAPCVRCSGAGAGRRSQATGVEGDAHTVGVVLAAMVWQHIIGEDDLMGSAMLGIVLAERRLAALFSEGEARRNGR